MGSSFTSPLLVYTLRASEFHPSLQHAIHNYEHEVGDRHYGALFSSAWSQSLEFGSATRCSGAYGFREAPCAVASSSGSTLIAKDKNRFSSSWEGQACTSGSATSVCSMQLRDNLQPPRSPRAQVSATNWRRN